MSETVATDRVAPRDAKTRVSDVCKGFLARMQKDLEAEEADDYWKAKFATSTSLHERPAPTEASDKVSAEDPESREGSVNGRSNVEDGPFEDRTEIATELANTTEALSKPLEEVVEQRTPLSSFFPEKDERSLSVVPDQRDEASVASSKRSTRSIRSIISKAQSITSKKSTASIMSSKPVPEIQLKLNSTLEQATSAIPYQHPMAIETVDTTKDMNKQKRRSLMKTILKSLKNMKREKEGKTPAATLEKPEGSEFVVPVTDVAPVASTNAESLQEKSAIPTLNEAVSDIVEGELLIQNEHQAKKEVSLVEEVPVEEQLVYEHQEEKEVSLVEEVSVGEQLVSKHQAERDVSLVEEVPVEEQLVLVHSESTHASVNASMVGPGSSLEDVDTLKTLKSTESSVQEISVSLTPLFQETTMASNESFVAPTSIPEEPQQELATAPSHDSTETHRQKFLSKLSLMENIFHMTQASDDSSIDPEEDAPEEPDESMRATNDSAPDTLLPKRDIPVRIMEKVTESAEQDTAFKDQESAVIETKEIESTAPLLEAPMITHDQEGKADEEKEATLIIEKPTLGEKTEITEVNQDTVLDKKEESFEKSHSKDVEPLVVECDEKSMVKLEETEVIDKAVAEKANQVESEAKAKAKKKAAKKNTKAKMKKTKKTNKEKKKSQEAKKGKKEQAKREKKDQARKESKKDLEEKEKKNQTKRDLKREKIEKLKFRLGENKRIVKAIAKMKSLSTTDSVIDRRKEVTDGSVDAGSSHPSKDKIKTTLEAISEAVSLTIEADKRPKTEEKGAVAEKTDDMDHKCYFPRQANSLSKRGAESPPRSPDFEPELSSCVKTTGNQKKTPRKMLSWSENVRDNAESPDEASTKPADSDNVESVIWWSASKEAVEVMCELEVDDEKTVQSEQSSQGDSTYNTLGSDPTFALEPDFSYSNFKTVTGEILEEAVMIGEEITAVGQRMLPSPDDFPEIPGFGSLKSWFSNDDTKESKKKKKKKNKRSLLQL